MSVITHKGMVEDRYQYVTATTRGMHKHAFMRIYHPVHHGFQRQNFGYISGAAMRHLGFPKQVDLRYDTGTHELIVAGTIDVEYGCHLWRIGNTCAGIALDTFLSYCGVGKLKAGRIYGTCRVTESNIPYIIFKLEEE